MPPEPDMTDPINWPAPMPNFEVGLYHYRCECAICGQNWWSHKGMLNPERAYRRHYWLRHAIVADVA
jgi:hypothetical protein